MTPTEKILTRFEQISAIPRGSKNETALRQWLSEWAAAGGYAHKTDRAGNLAVYVPASVDRKNAPVIILQAHMDMVCQKTPDSNHDFMRDPIRFVHTGDWLKADQTTLGADNGTAIAIILAFVESENASHPALELLFTVEEESGLVGADNLDPSLITGKTLINLDTEDDDSFTVGCAGGGSVNITLPVTWNERTKDEIALELKVSGLQGGHSGGDINKQRGNANKILARTLDEIQRAFPIRLSAFMGGTARNAIPRDAEAVFFCSKEMSAKCSEIVRAFEKTIQAEFAITEPNLMFILSEKKENAETAIAFEETKSGIQLIAALPNGVFEMSAAVAGFVETSNNIGVIELRKDGLHIVSNHRSSVISRFEEITRRVEIIANSAGARTERTKMYPPWRANMNSPLLKKCVKIYEALNHEKPKVELAHGGLECGIISERCGGLDTISFGPTIKNPHSPDETLYIPSLARTWSLLSALLREIN